MGNIDKDRIVCRCKKVSEGTIIEAIKNGADTYEKVKKETGANTYGCFACRLEIKKLLEENKQDKIKGLYQKTLYKTYEYIMFISFIFYF